MSFQTFPCGVVDPFGCTTYYGFQADPATSALAEDYIELQRKAHDDKVDAMNRETELKAKLAAAEKAAADKVAAEEATAAEKLRAAIAAHQAARAKGVTIFKVYVLAKTRHSAFHPALKFLVKKGVLTLTDDELAFLAQHFAWLGIGRWNPMNWCFPNEKTGKVGETDVGECSSLVGLDDALLRALCGPEELAALKALTGLDARLLCLVAYFSRAIAAAWARKVADGVSDALDMAHEWEKFANDCDEQFKQCEFPKLDAKKPKVNKPKASKPKTHKPKASKPKAEEPKPEPSPPVGFTPEQAKAAQILGVKLTFPLDKSVIEKAFRTIAPKLHPDKTGGDDSAFKEANSARDTLLAAFPISA